MAEYCKECFKKKILTSQEQRIINDEQIIMFEGEDICEGCGEFKPIVHFVKDDKEKVASSSRIIYEDDYGNYSYDGFWSGFGDQ